MKKLSLFLIVVLILTMLSGCSRSQNSNSKEPVLRVCVSDLNSLLYETVETMVKAYREENAEVKIKLEVLSTNLEDEAETKQMRTDIMAGKGPDLFILQARGQEADELNFLFPNVNKAIESGVFCNLDEYINNDKFWKDANIPEEILKAGRYNGHQYVLPITIDLPMIVQDEAEKVDISSEKTLLDCIEKVRESGNQKALKEIEDYCFTSRFQLLENALDYDEQEVLFDKTMYIELGKCLSEVTLQRTRQEESELGEFSKRSGASYFVKSTFEEENLDYQVIPTVMAKRTAYVQSYGAISANSKEKEIAYDFLRFFLDAERQGGKDSVGRYNWSIESGGEYPVNRDGFVSYLNEKPAKEEVLKCFDSIEDCVFLSQGSRLAGEHVKEVISRIISGEPPYTEKELKIFADEIFKKYEMILKE